MLPVTKELLEIPLKKPVEISDPVQALRMDIHAEPGVGQERPASGSGFLVTSVNGDNSLEITERLSLKQSRALATRSAPL